MNQKLGKRKRREQAGFGNLLIGSRAERRHISDDAAVTDDAAADGELRMYHGGGRGLAVGEYILTADLIGRSNTYGHAPEGVYRKDRVYITGFLQDAQLFACKDNDDPVVYVVEPVGELEPDDDNKTPGRSFACASAKIVAVEEIPARTIQQARNAIRANLRQ